MRWRKIKKAILEKPWLIDVYRVMSRKEARRITWKHGYPTHAELMERARQKIDMPYEEFAKLIGWDYRHQNWWVHLAQLKIKKMAKCFNKNFLSKKR